MNSQVTDAVLQGTSNPARFNDQLGSRPSEAEFRYGPDAIYIRPPGPGVGAREAATIMSAARREFAGRHRPLRRVLLDLESVLVPSSMAIGLLLEMAKLASSIDASLEVATESEFREVLSMLKLEGRYTMARSGRRLAESVR